MAHAPYPSSEAPIRCASLASVRGRSATTGGLSLTKSHFFLNATGLSPTADYVETDRREESRENRRRAILDAAVTCLLRDGYDGLKMSQVAAEAGVAKGTVYLYFSSKDGLVAAIADRQMGTLHGVLRARADSAPSGLLALREVLLGQLAFYDERPAVFRAMIDWWRRPNIDDASSPAFEAYRTRAGDLGTLVHMLFLRGQEDGSIRSNLDPFHDGLYIWATVLGTQVLITNTEATRARMDPSFDPEKLRRIHVDSIMRGLATAEAVW